MDYQVVIQACTTEEGRYQFLAFAREDALELGNLICQASKRYAQGVAVAIEINGLRVFQHVTEGAGKHNVAWLQRKINMVNQFGRSSLRTWAEFSQSKVTMDDECLPKMDFALCGGGFPLNVRGVGQVGVIAVSGLPHLDDHRIIVDALAELTCAKKK